jgi:outer membrane protein
MNQMKNWFKVFTLVMVCSMANAQDTTTTVLTYEEAIKIGLKNNLTLNQQKNNLFSRQVQKTQSYSAFLPTVSGFGQLTHTDGTQPSPQTGDLIDLSNDRFFANIQASMTIFNGFSTVNSMNQSVNQFRSQTSFVKRTEQDVINNVTNQYLLVLLDQELLKIAEQNYRSQNVVLDQLRELVSTGSRAEADLYTQDAQVRNLQVIAIRSRATLENDKALLAQMLQLDPAIPIAVEVPRFNSTFDLTRTPLDSLFEVALANREDLKQAGYDVKGNLYGYRAAIGGWVPTVSLFASYGSSFNSSLTEITTPTGEPLYGNFGNQFTRVFPTLSYGVQINIPIFDRLQTRRIRVQNRVAYQNSVLQRENLEKTVKIDVKRTYNNYLAAIEAYEAAQVQFQAGELALRTQQESYILGIAAQVAVAQANQTYVQAAASRAQAEVTLIFQKMLLEYALGTLKPENVSQD